MLWCVFKTFPGGMHVCEFEKRRLSATLFATLEVCLLGRCSVWRSGLSPINSATCSCRMRIWNDAPTANRTGNPLDGHQPHLVRQQPLCPSTKGGPETLSWQGSSHGISSHRMTILSAQLAPRTLWQKYNVSLERRPIVTKALTSVAGFAIGDAVAQWAGKPKSREEVWR